MLYRHQEILQVLFDHPKGLTTGDIYNIAKKQPGSELPDSSTVGKLVYAMRNGSPKLVNTHDAVGGNIHTLTPAGKESLQQALKEQGIGVVTSDTQSEEPLAMVSTTSETQSKQIEFDLSNEIDSALYTVATIIREAAAQPAIVIDQKAAKLALLESYETDERLNGTSRALFSAIHQDIAELDSAE